MDLIKVLFNVRFNNNTSNSNNNNNTNNNYNNSNNNNNNNILLLHPTIRELYQNSVVVELLADITSFP